MTDGSARPRPVRLPAKHRKRSADGRSPAAVRLLRRQAARLALPWRMADEPVAERTPPPPYELVAFLRKCGVALCRAGETADQVQAAVTGLGHRYGMATVHTFVLPTGVFVRAGEGPDAVVDFAPVEGDMLRLDQIGSLYPFLRSLYDEPLTPKEGTARLAEIEAMPPRFPAAVRVFGYVVLTLGLGMVTDPNPMAVAGYAVLGLVVGLLREVAAGTGRVLVLALPVIAAALVTAVANRYSGPVLGENPGKLLVPPLLAFLPGAALTMGTMELAAQSVVSGASRLVYGLEVLFLLAFGVTVGSQLVSPHPVAEGIDAHDLGVWAPWAGVLLLGLGHALNSSAALRVLPWLLLVLGVAKGAQDLGAALTTALLGAFLGGATLPLLARLLERNPNAPPDQVTFLPGFWLLVPGTLGLTGMDQLLGRGGGGVDILVDALLTVVAVALGVLVGASLVGGGARPGTGQRGARSWGREGRVERG